MKTIKFVAAILSGCGISGWTILAVIASAVEAANPNSGLPTEPITPPAEYAQAADAADARVYDDGVTVVAGATLHAPCESCEPYCRHRQNVRSGWWVRGPVRRFVSWPIRRLFCR